MEKSMRSYITPGLIHFMAYPETIRGEGPIRETVMEIAKDEYFGFIELAWIKDNAVRRDVKEILETAGMEIGYAAQPRILITGLNPNHPVDAERQMAVDILKEGVDEAYELGAVGMGLLSGPVVGCSMEEAFAALKESVSELCGYAASKGDLKIHLEVFDSDVDKKSLIGPAPVARRFAEEICPLHRNFGLMPDLSHLPLLNETPEEALIPVKGYISHAHMGNCVVKDSSLPAYGDQHPRFGFPESENGAEDIASYLRVLIDAGYLKEGESRPVSFEVKPYEKEDPSLVIANAKRALNRAWALV